MSQLLIDKAQYSHPGLSDFIPTLLLTIINITADSM